MLGLHNILLIAPPTSTFRHHHQQSQPISADHHNPSINQDCNSLSILNSWSLRKGQESGLVKRNAGLSVPDDGSGSLRVCRDCGNRAKKECGYRRCRTCCKGRGYDCATHVKSTWVPAAKRRERHSGSGGGGGGGSSGSSSGGGGGGKRPKLLVSSQNANSASVTSTSNAAAVSLSFDTSSSHQDASFKQSLPGQVQAPAVFRCIRVTAISGGEAEVAYQATVNISGHVFKGFLYDQGTDEKNALPCIAKLHFESSTSGRNRDSSSPILGPSNAHASSANQELLAGVE